jgi:small GTP-binding protein
MSYRGKIILLGDPAVGKTSLLSQFVDGKFFDEYIQTVGANFLIKEIDLKDSVEKLNINKDLIKDIQEKGFRLYFWDIGGQQDKLFVTEYYFVQSHGAIVVFNLVSKESFDSIDFWISKLKELSGDIPYIIVGNKIDLDDKRAISKEDIEKKVKGYGAEYFETSAKLDRNVNEAFLALSIQILNKLK